MITINELLKNNSDIIVAEHNYHISTMSSPVSKEMAHILNTIGHAVAIPEEDMTLFYYLDFKKLDEANCAKLHNIIYDCGNEEELFILREIGSNVRIITDVFITMLGSSGEDNIRKFLLNIYDGAKNEKRFITDLNDPLLSLLYFDEIKQSDYISTINQQAKLIERSENKETKRNLGIKYNEIIKNLNFTNCL